MKAVRDSRFCWMPWPGGPDTATSRTSLATSTAMVVDFMEGSSFSERSATQGDSGTSMPRESREESITSAEAVGAREARGGLESMFARRSLAGALGGQNRVFE